MRSQRTSSNAISATKRRRSQSRAGEQDPALLPTPAGAMSCRTSCTVRTGCPHSRGSSATVTLPRAVLVAADRSPCTVRTGHTRRPGTEPNGLPPEDGSYRGKQKPMHREPRHKPQSRPDREREPRDKSPCTVRCVAPRPGVMPRHASGDGTSATRQSKKARLNADEQGARRCTLMGLSPAWPFTADTAQPYPGRRVDAVAHVPSACIYSLSALHLSCLLAPPPAAPSHKGPDRHAPTGTLCTRSARDDCRLHPPAKPTEQQTKPHTP